MKIFPSNKSLSVQEFSLDVPMVRCYQPRPVGSRCTVSSDGTVTGLTLILHLYARMRQTILSFD
jgi:hypothetical protein